MNFMWFTLGIECFFDGEGEQEVLRANIRLVITEIER